MARLPLLIVVAALLQITASYHAQQFNAEGIRLMQAGRAADAGGRPRSMNC